MIAFAFAANADAQTRYAFGVVPQFASRDRTDTWQPLLDELSRRTGLSLQLKGAPRIPDFDAEFLADEFDFVYANPFLATTAITNRGYVPLVRDNAELYGILVVRKDSAYQQVGDLAGQAIAFPSPNAMAAHLLLRADLEKIFQIDFTPMFAQTHTSAYANVVFGKAAAAGGARSSFELQPPEIREQLRIVHQTRKFSPHPVLAHPRVPEAHRLLIQKAILELATTAEGKRLLERVPMRSPIVAKAADYEAIAALRLDRLSAR